MLNILIFILEKIAKMRICRLTSVNIDVSSKVFYRRIRSGLNYRLNIGKNSMSEANLIFEKEDASILIGNNTFIGNSFIICAERIEIGDDVLIAWGCTILDHNSHSVLWRERSEDVKDWYRGKKNWEFVERKPVIIKNKAWIGFNVIILKGVTIGEGAVVGAGSVVTKDVEPYTVVAGNPAKLIREVSVEDR